MSEIVVYTQALCGYCSAAKSLLSKKGVAFREIDVTFSPGERAKMTARTGGVRTTPQVFVGETHLGGCDDIYALDRAGKLDDLLKGTA